MASFFSDILTAHNDSIIVDAATAKGNVISATAVIELDVEPSVSDVLYYLDMPSNCKVKVLHFRNTDLDSGNAVACDVGIYAGETFKLTDGTTFNENDVILVDAFAKDENMYFQDNRKVGEDLRFSTLGSNSGLSGAQNWFWQLANLPEDPFKPLRIGVKITGAFGTFDAGTVILHAEFSGIN